MSGYRYGEYHDGPDPLAPPYDIRAALDEMSDAMLTGSGPLEALRDLLRRGLPATGGAPRQRGLDDLLKSVRRRRRELREQGRLGGTLERVRELLDRAVGQERAAIEESHSRTGPGPGLTLRRTELDTLPEDTAAAVIRLSGYDWLSPAARRTFDELRDLLRGEVLETQFRGMRDALAYPDPAVLRRVRRMTVDLNEMLRRDERGEHTQTDFDAFMREHGDLFKDRPETLEELVNSLARRAAASERMLAGMTPEQRTELERLIDQTLAQAGLTEQMRLLGQALRARRPDLAWTAGDRVSGDQALGIADATTVLEELADLAELENALLQDYPGARLDDVDETAVRRAFGRQAVDDLAALKRIERELERQGYLRRQRGKLELTPKAVRRIGQTALRRVFTAMAAGRPGEHDQPDAGAAGELTGATRPWRFADEQPIDVVRTVLNAAQRPGPITLRVDDFEVAETEQRSAAAVCLLVDLSYSMAIRGTWAVAKQTALALAALVAQKFPQDALQIIGFSNYARVLQPGELASLDWDMVQGTNLHHALLIAGRHLDRHPAFEPVVLVVTDGEPTARLHRDGRPIFDYPPAPETLELTLAEVDKMTRRRATINVFMLAEDERLRDFVDEVARRNGGRVFAPSADRLGEYVVNDFLRSRRATRRHAG
ncbi:vWA domain-containing protein [Rhizohabitans arisaemae]|uniref:vWA domain-containing protein n=1 Tax=Rhizohabitans arisaemae TaxID=2720610 RepID=UPI0024B085E3|nr:hypothetical protein [Rhizohabitans arisaemae]